MKRREREISKGSIFNRPHRAFKDNAAQFITRSKSFFTNSVNMRMKFY